MLVVEHSIGASKKGVSEDASISWHDAKDTSRLTILELGDGGRNGAMWWHYHELAAGNLDRYQPEGEDEVELLGPKRAVKICVGRFLMG